MARSKKDKTTPDTPADTAAGADDHIDAGLPDAEVGADPDAPVAVTPEGSDGQAVTRAETLDAGGDHSLDGAGADGQTVLDDDVVSVSAHAGDTPGQMDVTETDRDDGAQVAAGVADDSLAARGGEGTPPDLSEPPIADRHAPPPAAPVAQGGGSGGSGGGFFAMLLGGALAAGLGFLAAQYSTAGWPFEGRASGAADMRAEIDARLTEIEARAQAAEAAAGSAVQPEDLTVFQDGQANTIEGVANLNTRLEEIDIRFADLAQRLDALEKRPISEGVSDEAIAAYERELDTLREAIAQQRTEVDRKTEEAAAMEAAAAETARMTMASAALSRIRGAIDEGAPFEAAVLDLREAGVEPPALLSDAANEGVVTRAVLQDRFPEAARDALRDWRSATRGSDEGGGMGSIVSGWLGARSVTPRDGDDPDAVLSRAEAAVREGRINDALAEIETLPESARSALDAWERDARRRMDVRAAVDDLAQSLNQG